MKSFLRKLLFKPVNLSTTNISQDELTIIEVFQKHNIEAPKLGDSREVYLKKIADGVAILSSRVYQSAPRTPYTAPQSKFIEPVEARQRIRDEYSATLPTPVYFRS